MPFGLWHISAQYIFKYSKMVDWSKGKRRWQYCRHVGGEQSRFRRLKRSLLRQGKIDGRKWGAGVDGD